MQDGARKSVEGPYVNYIGLLKLSGPRKRVGKIVLRDGPI